MCRRLLVITFNPGSVPATFLVNKTTEEKKMT